jgi:hypothetical protein
VVIRNLKIIDVPSNVERAHNLLDGVFSRREWS